MTSHTSDRIKIPPGFWAALRELGLSAHEVVRQAQLPLTLINEPAGITTAQYFAIWQAYSDLVGDISQGIIKLSTAFETAQYPPSVMATYHARDYRDALNRMVRYKQMCPPEHLRIAEDGESCKQLLTQARHEKALEYLADPSLDIKEVAFLIGYEDQNSFYRAFRLWEGDTPAHWRSEHPGPTVTTIR